MLVSGTARTRLAGAPWPAANGRRCRMLCVWAEPTVGGDERVEITEILEMMVSGIAERQNPP